MNKTGKMVLGLIVLALIIWGISGVSKGGNTNTLKIGVILPMTGDAAAYGEPGKNVISLAVDEINAKGGVNGKQLEMIFEDGKCSGPDAASAAQKLVNVDKVQVIIGAFCSGESLAAEPVTTAAKVLLFSPGSSSPDLTGKSEFFARDYPSDSAQGKILADVAYTDKGYKKMAFIQEQTDYAAGVFGAFNTEYTSLGGTIVKEEFPTNTAEFRSSLTKLRAENPSALFIDVQTPAAGQRVLKQLAELKWKIPLFVSDIIPGDKDTVANYKTNLEGAIGAEFGVDENNPKFKALENNYKAKFGVELPFASYAQTEYDSVYIIKDGIEAVGYDGTKLADWVHTIKDWKGASGSVTIGSNGDPVTGHTPEVITAGAVVKYHK